MHIDSTSITFLILPEPFSTTALATKVFTWSQFAGLYSDYKNAQNMPPQHPLSRVTVAVMREICNELTKRSGQEIRLPTPEEWECAYRTGSNTQFPCGSASNHLGAYAHFNESSTCPVAQYKPNAWGFYDLAGNVWEVCSDPNWSPPFIGRGGSYASEAIQCSANYWIPINPDEGSEQIGFRLAMDITQEISDDE